MNQDFDPLERIVGEELRRLPALKAPVSLSKTVLDKVRSGPQLAWWQQSIWSWPSPARIGFLLSATLLFVLASGGNWFAGAGVQSSWQTGAQKLSALTALWNGLMVLLGSLAGIWEISIVPWLLQIGIAATCIYLFCVGLGTAFVRYTLKQS